MVVSWIHNMCYWNHNPVHYTGGHCLRREHHIVYTGVMPPSWSWLTEIVLSHKWRNKLSINTPRNTWVDLYSTSVSSLISNTSFINTSSKGPDVLARKPMRHTNTINIVSVDWQPKPKGTWTAYLVANDPSTHLVIQTATSGVVDSFTDTCEGSSPMHTPCNSIHWENVHIWVLGVEAQLVEIV